MWLVAGLGNPGRAYAGTRHNIGYEVVDLLSRRWGLPIERSGFESAYGKGPAGAGGPEVVLLKPQTFMNLSGQAVLEAMQFYKVSPGRVLIVLDDLALPVGQVRLRQSGSSGGQKGLGDVLLRLGRDDIGRVRIGIGAPTRMAAKEYVLARPTDAEREPLAEAIITAADAVETWMTYGAETAMNRYNRSR